MFVRWVAILLMLIINQSNATDYGLVYGQNTRMIMPLDKDSIGISVGNYTQKYYLLHSKVVESDSERSISSNFIVTPEVTEILPDTRQMLTIRRLSGVYPQDRESLVYVVGRFIPNSTDTPIGGKVDLAVTFSLKMFLRPASLCDGDVVEKSINKIDYKYEDGSLEITNLTPYHLTYFNLIIDGAKIDFSEDVSMLYPYKTHYLKMDNPPKVISWSLINDSGFETAQSSRNFTQ